MVYCSCPHKRWVCCQVDYCSSFQYSLSSFLPLAIFLLDYKNGNVYFVWHTRFQSIWEIMYSLWWNRVDVPAREDSMCVQTCEGILMRCKWYTTVFQEAGSYHVYWWESNVLHPMGIACIYHTSQVNSHSLKKRLSYNKFRSGSRHAHWWEWRVLRSMGIACILRLHRASRQIPSKSSKEWH